MIEDHSSEDLATEPVTHPKTHQRRHPFQNRRQLVLSLALVAVAVGATTAVAAGATAGQHRHQQQAGTTLRSGSSADDSRAMQDAWRAARSEQRAPLASPSPSASPSQSTAPPPPPPSPAAPTAAPAPARTTSAAAPVTGGTTCRASYYDEGQMTASGEQFNPDALTAAHRTLPLGTRISVTSVDTGRTVVVRINDRGPYVGGRCLDLSRAAFASIASLGAGTVEVRYQVL